MGEWRRTTNGRREISYDNTTWWPEEHDTAILAYQAERKEQDDALSVLRDLADDHRGWYIPDEIAGRIRALVAEHPKETT